MHLITEKKKKVLTVATDNRTAHGHVQQKRAFFQDRRTNRVRTRGAANRRAIEG